MSYLIRICNMYLYLTRIQVSSLIRVRHENYIVVATTLDLKTYMSLTWQSSK